MKKGLKDHGGHGGGELERLGLLVPTAMFEKSMSNDPIDDEDK